MLSTLFSSEPSVSLIASIIGRAEHVQKTETAIIFFPAKVALKHSGRFSNRNNSRSFNHLLSRFNI